jgi:hypothetical protein
VVKNAKLSWLGDVFAIPKAWPLSNVFSVGDVIVVIAIGYLAQASCRRRSAGTEGETVQAPALITAVS